MTPARLVGLIFAFALVSCGGGGGNGGSTPSQIAPTTAMTPAVPATPNTTTITLDAGPAALANGTSGYSAFNEPYVTITLCAPGSTSNCQTIDHIIVDTGSVGLRIIQSIIAPDLQAALPTETDLVGNPVGECYQYVNSFAFGSVRQADFAIAGEKVSSMPFQVIADAGRFAAVPDSCSSGGGTAVITVQDFGANGILGVGTTTTDCGAQCTSGGGTSAATYYDCPATGCGTIVARAANVVAPFEQLPNPVAAFPIDNNGTIITLPSVPSRGLATVVGSITFGIGTQADNKLTATTLLPLTTSSSRLGPGVLTAIYKGESLTQSFFDSGSNDYFFIDTSLPPCTDASLIAFYCPVVPTTLSAQLTASNGSSINASFILYSPLDVATSSSAAPGLGLNPTLIKPPLPFGNSFDFGVPFFFGQTIFTAIEGRTAGGFAGPYVGF